MDAGGFHFVIYQHQVDQWKKDHLQARAAVTVTRSGDSTPVYGIVSLTARTDVDKERRWVTLEDLKVSSVSFPAAVCREHFRPALEVALEGSEAAAGVDAARAHSDYKPVGFGVTCET
jgi:hypothetical protein